MKVRKTGLYISTKEGPILLHALGTSLLENCNVKMLLAPCSIKQYCEICLSPTSREDIRYRDAKVLIKYAIKYLKRTFKRVKKDRKFRKKIIKRLLSEVEHKTNDLIESSDLKSISDTTTCNSQSTIIKDTNSKEDFNANFSSPNSGLLEENKEKNESSKYCCESKLVQTESTAVTFIGTNASALKCDLTEKTGLRPVIIDGSNVAFSHGKHIKFSFDGLITCINYFKTRGHKVVAVLPNFRKAFVYNYLLKEWETDGTLVFTPSRKINDFNIVCEDDRYIIQTAVALQGVIVSLDQYRNFLGTNEDFDKTIKERLLMYTWVEDQIIFPEDPLGPNGPTLDEFLRF